VPQDFYLWFDQQIGHDDLGHEKKLGRGSVELRVAVRILYGIPSDCRFGSMIGRAWPKTASKMK
jgi:hypothetical protein